MKLPKLQRKLFDPIFVQYVPRKGCQRIYNNQLSHYLPVPIPGNLYPMFSKPIH